MKRAAVLLGVLGVGGVIMLAAQQAGAPRVAEVQKVRDNLYMFTGGGGNTAAFITEHGVVLVDTKLAGWGQAILDALRTVTNKPVTMIINTHTHGDHVGSNDAFPPTVEIVAHENTRKNMEKMPAFQGDKAQFLPKRTYRDRLNLLSGRDRVDLYYFGRGHTDGDTIIVFPFLRVAHTGDLFARRGAPLIDMKNGGSGVEYPATLEKAASTIKDVETVIPGHSAVTDWKAFQEYAEFNRAFLTAVERALKEGRSAEEAAASLALPEKFKDYDLQRAKENVEKIYTELRTSNSR